MQGLIKRRASLLGLACLPLLAACASDRLATPADIAGQVPLGSIKLTQRIEAGVVKGNGEFRYQGITYTFPITGKLLDPGADGVIIAEGSVYNFNQMQEFTGRYVQAPGPLGYRGEPSTDLWLRNQSGVVIRVRTRDNVALPQIGRAELYFPQLT